MSTTRRHFIQSTVTASAFLVTKTGLAAQTPAEKKPGKELQCDVAILGGGLGGCAAALAALRLGKQVILTESTDWLGGQATSQAVPFDENRWIETIANPSYARLRNGIRDYYRRNFPLTREAMDNPKLNPGLGGVSRICCEPRVVLSVLEEMLAPWRSAGRLTVLLNHRPVAADCTGDRITSVKLEDQILHGSRILVADYFLDATERGDLLPLVKAEFVTGAEAQSETGELHAAEKTEKENQQAFTVCFAMSHHPGENHVINRPEEYSFWRDYIPALTPAWPGKLLSWQTTHPVTLENRTHPFDPIQEGKNEIQGLWRYRRILYSGHLTMEPPCADICLVNWPQNDYLLGNLYGGTPEDAVVHLRRAVQLSLSLFYWMQTEAPRADGGTGWPGLKLCPDVTGTTDGLAKHPYIRESRRIRALFTVKEQHVGREMREKETGKTGKDVRALRFEDSVGVGHYRIDLHPSTGGDNYIDIDSLPFEIPLGALIPVRLTNLLAACKNIGTTHITNGCYRLHPVEWNIGEAAGLLAAWCLDRKLTPHQVSEQTQPRGEFLKILEGQGIPLHWPEGIFASE